MSSKALVIIKGLLILTACFYILSSSASGNEENKGIELQKTRVVYPSSAKNGITFMVTNQSSYVYLLQSRVVQWTSSEFTDVSQNSPHGDDSVQLDTVPRDDTGNLSTPPFIVLPPLVRFEPDETVTLRIRLTKKDLSNDRESLFGLSLKAIPSQKKPSSDNKSSDAHMVLALQNNLKLFYRPEGIKAMSADERATALQLSRTGTRLNLKNPTPYYITFGQLTEDDTPVKLGDQRMIAPYSSMSITLTGVNTNKISWQLIDDEGKYTSFHSQLLR